MAPPRNSRRASAVLLALAALAGCRNDPEPPAAWSPDSVPEAYRRSVAALMWPGATRAFQVTPEGDLFNGEWWVRFDLEAGGVAAAPPRTIAYEDRWCPVTRWTRRSGAVRWEFEAVPLPDYEPSPFSRHGSIARSIAAVAVDQDRRRLVAVLADFPAERIESLLLRARRPLERQPLDRRNLFVSLQAEVVNEGPTPSRVRPSARFAPAGPQPPYHAKDSESVPWHNAWDAGGDRDPAIGWGTGRKDGRALADEFVLAPGERRRLRMVLAAYPAPALHLRRRARVPHATCVAEIRRHWQRELARGARFDLPDPEVTSALRAATLQLLALRERRADGWVPVANPFQYRDVWLRDGARQIHALAVAGYTREAREMARTFLRYQWPHGPFVSQTGQLDGTGQALWAFDQALARPSRAAGTERFAAAALAAWRALERQRAASAPAAGELPGLLPTTLPHDNELVRAQLVGNDAWAIAGYRAAARLLRAAGRAAEADSVERSERAYRERFRRAAAATGRADLPPSWQGGGIDWGNLAAGWPCGALPAADPRLAALAHRYGSAHGGLGLGWYGDPDSLHGYVAADLGTWALLAGERALADRALDAMLEWRSASGGAAEIFTRSGRDFGANFPPHGTAAAALVALVRNALVFDDADTLMLALGARARWWEGSALGRAPTRWGSIDLAFHRTGDRAHWRWTPVPVWTALALPPGTAPAEALAPPLVSGPRPDLVMAPPGTRAASLAIRPAGAPPS